ncbi:hypothetical protein AKJ16_DCAP14917 [Drosera capensis]
MDKLEIPVGFRMLVTKDKGEKRVEEFDQGKGNALNKPLRAGTSTRSRWADEVEDVNEGVNESVKTTWDLKRGKITYGAMKGYVERTWSEEEKWVFVFGNLRELEKLEEWRSKKQMDVQELQQLDGMEKQSSKDKSSGQIKRCRMKLKDLICRRYSIHNNTGFVERYNADMLSDVGFCLGRAR